MHETRALGLGLALLVGLAPACGGSGGDEGAGGNGADNGSGAGQSGPAGSGGGTSCPPPDNNEPEPTPAIDFVGGATVDTLAGSEVAGSSDGTGTNAAFDNPVNVEVAANGNLTVAEFESSNIRQVTAAGEVTTLMSSQTGFSRPFGLAYSDGGTLFVGTDTNTDGNNADGLGSMWTVDTSVGDAHLVAEAIGRPRGLAFSGSTLIVSNPPHHGIRTLNTGDNSVNELAGQWNCPGFADGQGSEAQFYIPYDIDLMPNGDIIVVDAGNHAIRRMTPDGKVATVAGTGQPGMVDGDLDTAQFKAPRAVAVSDEGLIYVSDLGNHRIRRIDIKANVVHTLAGDGTPGFANGPGEQARFFGMEGLDLSPDGTLLYVADGTEGKLGEPFNRIRVITLP